MTIAKKAMPNDASSEQSPAQRHLKDNFAGLTHDGEKPQKTANKPQISSQEPNYHDYLDSEYIELEDIDYMIF